MNDPAREGRSFFSTTVDWTIFQPTRARVRIACAMILALSAGVTLIQFIGATDYAMPSGGMIGGDFVSFKAAAEAVERGIEADAYDSAKFQDLIVEHTPVTERLGLFWHYPPTYFFPMAPLAALDYGPALLVFIALSAALFIAVMRGAGVRGVFMLAALAAPASFQTAITGQNGFVTACLLAGAGLQAQKRPWLAGLCAALLTMKPQLGLALPLAYAAGGCWRAFAVAALGGAALVAASVAVHGPDTWMAFLGGIATASDTLSSGQFPLFKMITPYSAALFAGLPISTAATIHVGVAAAAIAIVAWVWRRCKDAELRAAALCGAVFFAAPYAYYYDLVILAIPVALLAKRAAQSGWMRGEQPALIALYLSPFLLPGDGAARGVSIGFLIVLLASVVIFRRIAHERPEIFRFASARFRPQSG